MLVSDESLYSSIQAQVEMTTCWFLMRVFMSVKCHSSVPTRDAARHGHPVHELQGDAFGAFEYSCS